MTYSGSKLLLQNILPTLRDQLYLLIKVNFMRVICSCFPQVVLSSFSARTNWEEGHSMNANLLLGSGESTTKSTEDRLCSISHLLLFLLQSGNKAKISHREQFYLICWLFNKKNSYKPYHFLAPKTWPWINIVTNVENERTQSAYLRIQN